MADVTHAPGWWQASDGNWYPPHLHPQTARPAPALVGPPPTQCAHTAWAPPDSAPLPRFPDFKPFGPAGPDDGTGRAAYAAPAGGGWPPPTAPPVELTYGYDYPGSAPKTNGLAVASLVLSIISLVGLGSIAGIVLGFVSRGQIRRSNGAQQGAGLGLAGIIVGFVTLSLVLLAIAIPTFLGVEAHSPSVVRLPPAPIALGTPDAGGSAGPMAWGPRTQPYDTTVTPVSGGVDVVIASPEHVEWVGAPVQNEYPSIQLSADVAIVVGNSSNGIGLGCATPAQDDQLAFFVHGSGLWEIMAMSARSTVVVDSGRSPAIHPDGSNSLTIACRDDLTRRGATQVSFDVNGTSVANDIVDLASSAWLPTIQLCSCGGADTGRFLDVSYYHSLDATTTSF
ncbi:MAG TPA: DUF4190 domain-containing protein [Acidimicrobiales bacterium]